MTKNNLANTLINLSGQKNVITVYRAFVDFTGTLEAAMMLSQLLYWTPKSKNNGWIAKSDKDFQEELCLSRRAIRGSRIILLNLLVITTKKAQFNGAPTMHYRINLENLDHQWDQFLSESEQSIIPNGTNDDPEQNERLSQTEQSITKTTPKITKEDPPPEKKPKPKSQYVLNMEHLEIIFADERPCPPPDWKNGTTKEKKGFQERWRTPLNTILKECGGNLEFASLIVCQAIREMKKDRLSHDAPGSILKTAKSLIYDHYSRQRGELDAPNLTTNRIEATEQQKAMEQQSP